MAELVLGSVKPPGRRAARASNQFDHYDGTGRKAKHASVPFRHVCALELRCKKFLYELKAGLRAAACGGRPRADSNPRSPGTDLTGQAKCVETCCSSSSLKPI
jgi:hypothetical protein